jgi:hypothetical protein
MLNRRPTVGITRSNQYQVRAQVDKVKPHFIQSARDNIAELYDLHHFESAAEHLELIDSLLADNKALVPGNTVCRMWCTRSKSNADRVESR